ncbi:MAG: DNA-processing protein DprA [Candidatus Bruticola sp.]
MQLNLQSAKYQTNCSPDKLAILWTLLSSVKGLSEAKLNRLAVKLDFNPELVKEELQRQNEQRPESRKYVFPTFDQAAKQWYIHSRKYKVISINDSSYPQQLLDLDDPPVLLYCRGSGSLNFSSVSIVGSRQADGYGQAVARQLSSSLAQYGLTIVSGLALGVDTCAHQGALAVQGSTAAVLGCGINICYPVINRNLSQAIEQNGLIISEYPENYRPMPYNFPYRNRIIAALSGATLVVQAKYKSGAMITADIAANLGRQVLAVPGQINVSQSEGPLELLANGAGLVRNSLDVLDSLGLILPEKTDASCSDQLILTAIDSDILKAIDSSGTDTNTIAERTSCPMGYLVLSLRKLELGGYVMRLPNSLWIKTGRL